MGGLWGIPLPIFIDRKGFLEIPRHTILGANEGHPCHFLVVERVVILVQLVENLFGQIEIGITWVINVLCWWWFWFVW